MTGENSLSEPPRWTGPSKRKAVQFVNCTGEGQPRRAWTNGLENVLHSLQEQGRRYRAPWIQQNEAKLQELGGWGLDFGPMLNADALEAAETVELPGGTVHMVDGVLPDEWCARLIEVHEAVGFTPQNLLDTQYSPPLTAKSNALLQSYRGGQNTSEVIEVASEALARVLWQRLQHIIPEQLTRSTSSADCEEFRVACIIPTFRFMRYQSGQAFAAHTDPARITLSHPITGAPGVFRSFVTLALYLNDASDFEGGALRFLELAPNPLPREPPGPPAAGLKENHAKEYRPLVHRQLASVAPKRGRCAVFEHQLLHEAGELASGVKHMVQCDVLYQRRD
jgi:hypothetical protein